MSSRSPLCLMSCGEAGSFAANVADALGQSLTPSRDVWFACGEGKHVIDTNVRGTDVYIVQQPVVPGSDRSVYDRWTMLLHAVDAARCADASRVTVIVPYLPGSRQDKRKGHIREGISTGLFARMLQAAGVSMLITVEPHNEAMIGCFDPRRCVFESVTITQIFSKYLLAQGVVGDVVASTDVGGLEMARAFAMALRRDIVALSKERDYSQSNVVTRSTLIGEVAQRSVLIIDDIVDTAGSVQSAVRSLWEAGATDITVAGVHMLLSGPAWQRLDELAEEAKQRGFAFHVVGTSSICHPNPPEYYLSCSLEPLIARIIQSVNTRGSIRALEDEVGS